MEVELESIEEKIIKATFDILENEGLKGATTRKIAKKANVSEVTLFRKFKTKENLIKTAKIYHTETIIKKLNEIFDFNETTSIEDYFTTTFYKVVNLTDKELNIIKIGIEEVRNIPRENNLFLKISETILKKLKEFFILKITQKQIRNVNPDILSLNIFSILFQSMILWKVYGKTPKYEIDKYINDFLDITLNGIKM